MRFGKQARRQRVVIDALEAVGESGMTPLALAVTTELPEAQLQTILNDLTECGVLDRRADRRSANGPAARTRYRLALPPPQRS